MERSTLGVVTLVCFVLLAGCTTLIDAGTSETTAGPSTPTVSTEPGTTAPGTTSQTPMGESTMSASRTTTASTTSSPTPRWTEPEPPNEPFEEKMDAPPGNRIEAVGVLDGSGSTAGEGGIELRMTANTSMSNVDPAEHGTVRGEPFFLVYADGSLTNGSRFSYPNGTLLARSDVVSQDADGEYALTVPDEAFDDAGVEDGELEIMVLLMDRDSEWDDIYGYARITVEYASDG